MDENFKNKTIIKLKRTFPCTTGILFEAFLDPEVFRQWFSPHGFTAKKVEINPVIGGEYKCELERTDGMKLVIKGRYEEIIEYSKICFTFMYEPDVSSLGTSKVTVTFTETGNSTEIILFQEINKVISTEGRAKGCEHMFSKLEEIIIDK